MPRLIGNVFLALLLIISGSVFADEKFINRKDVQEFIQKMVKKYNFDQNSLVDLFNHVKIHPQVIRHINKPLEKEPWRMYQRIFVNQWRITHGVEFWNKYKDALNRAEKKFGVPASIIVATIGIETRYGQRTGSYRVIDSLSNIAFSSSSRASFFKKELEQFLLLTREEKLNPLKVMGSYAGAIGQPQFMPSSYRYYAVNFSGSGKKDLMNDEVDVIGSIANYYKKHGWVTDDPITVEAVVVGDRFNYFKRYNSLNRFYKLSDLTKYGLMTKNPVNYENLPVKIIDLSNHYNKEYWLGFKNFDVIKRYNQSDLYAMAVYQLSYYIKTLRNRLHKE